jgi:hypothetical protein
VWQQRENAGQGNRDGGRGCFNNCDAGQRNAAAANVESNETDTTGGALALTEATGQNSERGSQNGPGFGRGAYLGHMLHQPAWLVMLVHQVNLIT